MKNKFGNTYDKLPIELQKEIMLQNTTYYQQILANLLIEHNKLSELYLKNVRELQILQNPLGEMTRLINIHENTNKNYNNRQRENAYARLNNYYKPLVLNLKEEIKKLKNSLINVLDKIKKNKKKYYYFYSQYKKI